VLYGWANAKKTQQKLKWVAQRMVLDLGLRSLGFISTSTSFGTSSTNAKIRLTTKKILKKKKYHLMGSGRPTKILTYSACVEFQYIPNSIPLTSRARCGPS
jgi:hypothetical protein